MGVRVTCQRVGSTLRSASAMTSAAPAAIVEPRRIQRGGAAASTVSQLSCTIEANMCGASDLHLMRNCVFISRNFLGANGSTFWSFCNQRTDRVGRPAVG